MLHDPIYDPQKPFEENYAHGPTDAYLKSAKYSQQGEPHFELFGKKIYSPFGVPAGPIFNSKYAKAAYERGFDVLVYKTVRSKERPCNPFPNIVPLAFKGNLTRDQAQGEGVITTTEYREPLAITNSFGVPSVSPDIWQPDMKKTLEVAGRGQMLICAFQGTSSGEGEQEFIDDHSRTARMVMETGAEFFEVNTSCPNEGAHNLLCYDIARMEKIIHAIKNEIGNKPLVVKIAYFSPGDKLRELLMRIGSVVEGISAINTIAAKIYSPDQSQALPGKDRLVSGVCGTPIKWAGVDMVGQLRILREELNQKFSIIGVGGVMNAADFQEYRTAGADCVMSATGMMWNPYLAKEVKESLH
jgi:dihydroorotate dehydrogenase